jgi:hypothetical protein
MKPTTISFVQRLFLAVVAAFISVVAIAQEGGGGGTVDVNITKKDNFWASPWVWVIGGAVFVLLLAAILRGGGSRRDA